MKLLKLVTFGAAAAFVWLFSAPPALASPYGTQAYSDCIYNDATACSPPVIIPPATTPPPTTNDPSIATRDIDDSTATAADNNSDPSDGYETFDTTASAPLESLATLDGDDDGKTDYILDDNGDSQPDYYWDPDDNILSTVEIVDCGNDGSVEWRFDSGTTVRTYSPSTATYLETCNQSTTPTQSPTKTSTDKSAPLPTYAITGTFLGSNGLYEALGKLLQKIPKVIAYSFPYFLLLLILILIMRFTIQSRHEAQRYLVAKKTREAEQLLMLEKDNFMMLTSHYLRTPITIIQGNIDIMQSMNKISTEAGKVLEAAGKILAGEIANVLSTLQNDTQLAAITNSTVGERPKIFTVRFIGPLVGILTLLVIAELLLIDFRVISPSVIELAAQVLIAVLAVQLFVSTLRRRQIRRQNSEEEVRLLEQQRALDATKSQFINTTANNLERRIDEFTTTLATNKEEVSEMADVRLKVLELTAMVKRFRLVAQLQASTLPGAPSTIDTVQLTQEILDIYKAQAQEKGISFTLPKIPLTLYQRKDLVKLILATLVENAIKFSPAKSQIVIETTPRKDQAVFTVTDFGEGIAKAKQELLFKPFSRTDSAEVFNTEGLGFSLFLDRVIAAALQGNLSLESNEGAGTSVRLEIPNRAPI